MKHLHLIAVATFAFFEASIAFSAPVGSNYNPQLQGGQEVVPGVTWFTDKKSSGPLSFNVLKVDLADPHVTLEAEASQDALNKGETVLDAVKREEGNGPEQIVGGVNSDFWANSPAPFTSQGLMVADGMIYNMPSKRSVFVLTKDERPFIGKVSMKVSLQNATHNFKIDTINSATTNPRNIVLITPPFGKSVQPFPGTRYLLKMDSAEFLPNQPVSVDLSPVPADQETQLDANTLVLHVGPKASSQKPLQPGRYTLAASLPEVSGAIASVCGGGPALVRDGKVNVVPETKSMDFITLRHPRTAVGFTADGKTVYLVTVDGRQPKLSVGANLYELGNYMQGLGCAEAMNLDGGGSTTMVVNGKIVSSPSDLKGARPVVESLLVVYNK